MINIQTQKNKKRGVYSFYIIRKLVLLRRKESCAVSKNGCLFINDNIQFMIQQRLPEQIAYPIILPKGFPSVYKQWQLDPMSSNKQWSNNDIVRFNFMNLGKGVFDPYRSYIEITVSTSQTYTPVGLLQIDSSAQSFISQSVLYSDNRQIQRITDYDVLAAYLNDIGYDELISQGREVEGLGYGSFDTMPYPKPSGAGTIASRFSGPNVNGVTQSCGNTFPTIGNLYPEATLTEVNNSITNAACMAKGHVTNSNVVTTGTNLNGGDDYTSWSAIYASLKIKGYANNIRSEYQAKYIQNKFPQSTQSIPTYELLLNNNLSNGQFPFYFNSSIPYNVQARNTMPLCINYDGPNTANTHVINSANFGFNSLFCPYFTRGTFQPCISPTVPQLMLYNGEFLPTKIPIMRRKFKIPLISGVIGVLIDPSQFLLIPLAALQKCLLQITLCPHAMFTSGYCDVSQFDNIGMANMQKRNYCIERIKYKLQTYHFLDNDVQIYLQTALNRQITIISNFWALSNQYQIPGGTQPNNSYIVGCNSTHLNEMVCLFVPNDYQTFNHCRKHTRLSNNVVKYWSKLAVDYWPPQPYKGNGGNVFSNNYDDDNSVFVENIYATYSYLFTKSVLPRINTYNFAINNRPYNPSNTNTFYDPSLLNNQNYAFNANSVNADTAMGMAWIHENRVVGKAAYIISYTPFKPNINVLNGINVSAINNFEAIFECNSQNVFPRDQTLYIFTRSSGITKYSKQGIKTFGRG